MEQSKIIDTRETYSASKAFFHRCGRTGVDDVELIAGDGSNLVLTADHGDLGRHGFGRRVRISGTAVM